MPENEAVVAANGSAEPTDVSPATETERPASDADGEPFADGAEGARAFSRRLQAVSSKRVDDFVAEMGLVDPYRGGRPIRTQEDYAAWQQRLTAENVPSVPQEASREPFPEPAQDAPQEMPDETPLQLLEQLHTLESERRDRELLEDEAHGAAYRLLRDKVQQVMTGPDGQLLPLDRDAVYGAVLLRELPEVLQQLTGSAREEALRAVQAAGTASPGALGGQAAAPAPDFASMPSEEFAAYRRRALCGEMI